MPTNPRMRILGRATDAFGVAKIEPVIKPPPKPRIAPSIPKPSAGPSASKPPPESVSSQVDQIMIDLKKDTPFFIRSTVRDENGIRTVRILESNKIINDHTVEFVDEFITKIVPTRDIKGSLQISYPQNVVFGELEVVEQLNHGIFRLPINLTDNYEDLKVTSFVIDGIEQMKEPVEWETMDLFFLTPEEKVCKYDYGYMINKLFEKHGFSTCLNPDFVTYETECIQKFTWPPGVEWSITTSEFVIDSTKLEDVKTMPITSLIVSWDDVDGVWESVWQSFGGAKEIVAHRGTWQEVVEKLIPNEWECFANGIICPAGSDFTFCIRKGEDMFLFTSL